MLWQFGPPILRSFLRLLLGLGTSRHALGREREGESAAKQLLDLDVQLDAFVTHCHQA
jgi:hypothetical protein